MSYDFYDYDARASSKSVIASSLIHTTLDLVLCLLKTLTCYNARPLENVYCQWPRSTVG